MKRIRMKRVAMAVALVILPVIAAACGGGNTGGSSSGSTASCPAPSGNNGNGAHVSIGSKGFAEEQLLAEMTKLVLEHHGFTVDYTFMAKDKAIGQAVTSGTIDMLWQYTGTELGDYLGLTGFPTDLHQAFVYVQQQDQSHGLCWTAETPFDDTNGLAIKDSDRAIYGDSLASFGAYLLAHKDNPATVCILSEFRTRPDGIPGLENVYGSGYTYANWKDIGSTAEKNIANGECVAGEVFTTDSAIMAKNLHVLTDEKKLFPPDNAGLIVRQSVLQAHPEIAALMAPVAMKLDTATMISLNAMVELQNLRYQDVAQAWLMQNGFLS
jgi:osmoprotectant transport system substrate-binding protein